MSANGSLGFDAALLDEFYTEADEHLLAIRQAFVRLEASLGKPQPDAKALESLLSHFHSFKGISAIVGLSPAENLAHATEDYLRLMRDGHTQPTAEGGEILMRVGQKLEQIVGEFRAGNPLPECVALLADLKKCGESVSSLAAPTAEPMTTGQASDEPMPEGLSLWLCTFSPSRELSERGVNVDAVRRQLEKFGSIRKSTPVVKGQGMITFEFQVEAKANQAEMVALEAMSVRIRPEQSEGSKPGADVSISSASEEVTYNPFLAPSHLVRVDLKHLDELMRIAGELVIQRSRLDVQLAQAAGGGDDLHEIQEVSGAFGTSLRDLREAIMRMRLIPVAEIFNRLPFVVRDIARGTGKKARLKLTGQDTAIDKYLIERLKDPLLHLVRNAFSHGVETVAERVAQGKPEEAVIELSASTAGESVIIQVRDDGKGVDEKAILQRAAKLGLPIPQTVDHAALLGIICSPGFSTRDEADRVAGRGVGMGVVASTLRELGGQLTLDSEPGRGTRFTLRLPLTLTIAQTLIVSAAGQTCAMPQSFVREILQTSEKQIELANGVEVIPYRSGVLPVVRLSSLFNLKTAAKPNLCLLVIMSDRGSAGLLVERVVGQREVVVRALRDPLIQVPGIIGATELGDGKPVLILDGAALTSGHVCPSRNGSLAEEQNLAGSAR